MPHDPSGPSGRDGALVLGVDLGGTKVRAAVADESGAVLAEMATATDPRGGRHVVDQIAVLGRSLVSSAGAVPAAVRATAVGTPGVPDAQNGTLGLSPNVDGLSGVSLRDELAAELGHPVVLENDVTAAAVGERWVGSARGCADFVFIAVGTGIGMGIVSGGRVVRGAHGAAGEIGYLPLGTDPFDPVNQHRGALEEATAGETVAARYSAATGTATSTREVFDLAARGVPAAVAVVAEHGRLLALTITAVTAVLDPALVVLGGGVGSRPELLSPVRAALAELGKAPVDVRTTTLGTRASVVGTLDLALRAARLGSDPEDSE
ncbi:ROK family protein [Blastococcus sp. PRF04-17]|uniref:ROK family protein n=1 Tax=Blastococcus sp. PRF04-17 TaxID=2933797 RepID=UPI001FF4742E|nr:ROK family protein [Blastococcus sp. PRF04-17]UOY02860.1 ROK family protein [Blastococcus sp. PRF04-17]